MSTLVPYHHSTTQWINKDTRSLKIMNYFVTCLLIFTITTQIERWCLKNCEIFFKNTWNILARFSSPISSASIDPNQFWSTSSHHQWSTLSSIVCWVIISKHSSQTSGLQPRLNMLSTAAPEDLRENIKARQTFCFCLQQRMISLN